MLYTAITHTTKQVILLWDVRMTLAAVGGLPHASRRKIVMPDILRKINKCLI